MGPPVQLDVGEIPMDFPLNGHIASIMPIQHGIHRAVKVSHAIGVGISHRDVFPAGRGKRIINEFAGVWGDFNHEAYAFVMHGLIII